MLDFSWLTDTGNFILLILNQLSVIIMGSAALFGCTLGLWIVRKVVDIIKKVF